MEEGPDPEIQAQADGLHYRLQHGRTDSGIGYFTCAPPEDMDLNAALDFLSRHPNDGFMAEHLLRSLSVLPQETLAGLAEGGRFDHPRLKALLAEAAILFDNLPLPGAGFAPSRALALETPLVYLRAWLREDRPVHDRWVPLVRRNIQDHVPLEQLDSDLLELPEPVFDAPCGDPAGFPPAIEAVREAVIRDYAPGPSRPPLSETLERAESALNACGVRLGPLQRHEASLSPIALLRQWNLDRRVASGRHRYRLEGTQTAYGRGLDLDAAKTALAMEIVERYSAFAGIAGDKVQGLARSCPLIFGRAADLVQDGLTVLNPDELILDAPGGGQALYWMEGTEHRADGLRPIWVPVQSVFLFTNLDEARLYAGLGSTGLASGNTPAEALLSALLEIVERDHENVTPFDPERCFSVEADDPGLGRLLERYLECGIHIRFQDLTSDLGIPCCKCFVTDPAGRIIRGAGAHLNALRALVSALTETPYPFPGGPPSGPALECRIRVPLSRLPDYSLKSPESDVRIVERLLLAHGFRVIHVDLTRGDLCIPVVRALVPGMDILGDFSRFSRLHPRLHAHLRRRRAS